MGVLEIREAMFGLLKEPGFFAPQQTTARNKKIVLGNNVSFSTPVYPHPLLLRLCSLYALTCVPNLHRLITSYSPSPGLPRLLFSGTVHHCQLEAVHLCDKSPMHSLFSTRWILLVEIIRKLHGSSVKILDQADLSSTKKPPVVPGRWRYGSKMVRKQRVEGTVERGRNELGVFHGLSYDGIKGCGIESNFLNRLLRERIGSGVLHRLLGERIRLKILRGWSSSRGIHGLLCHRV